MKHTSAAMSVRSVRRAHRHWLLPVRIVAANWGVGRDARTSRGNFLGFAAFPRVRRGAGEDSAVPPQWPEQAGLPSGQRYYQYIVAALPQTEYTQSDAVRSSVP